MISHAPSETRLEPANPPALLPRLVLGLALLWLAMAATAVVAPELQRATGGGDHPDDAVIAGTGLAMIALSCLFLAYVSRVVGLGLGWLALAALTNALILVFEFVLGPVAFYQTTFVQGDLLFNVESSAYFPILAAGLFCVSALTLAGLYAWQRARVGRALGRQGEPPRRRQGLLVTLITVPLALAVPVLLVSSISLIGYGLLVVTASAGTALLVGLLGVITGTATMRRAATASISLRSAAIVTSVFWLALSMLLVYHVVWVVFMTALVSLWPLKVVAPSGK